jgi:hypothetical protein
MASDTEACLTPFFLWLIPGDLSIGHIGRIELAARFVVIDISLKDHVGKCGHRSRSGTLAAARRGMPMSMRVPDKTMAMILCAKWFSIICWCHYAIYVISDLIKVEGGSRRRFSAMAMAMAMTVAIAMTMTVGLAFGVH